MAATASTHLANVHDRLIDLTAVAALLAEAAADRTVADDDQDKPSVAAAASALARDLAALRDAAESHLAGTGP